jgi:hypothetical protein
MQLEECRTPEQLLLLLKSKHKDEFTSRDQFTPDLIFSKVISKALEIIPHKAQRWADEAQVSVPALGRWSNGSQPHISMKRASLEALQIVLEQK